MAKTTFSLFDVVAGTNPGLDERAVIRLACEQLLSEAEAEPPIPVERVASLRGIVEIGVADQPFAGMLSPRGSNLVVTVRSSDGYERQRFTVCHETGHTFFAGYSQRQFRCGGEKTPLEQRCDIAAAELLLPHRFFEVDLAAGGFDLSTTEDLAEGYQASIEASALRSVDLWKEPAMLLVFRHRHKPAERGREHLCEPQLRLDYAHSQGEWPYLRHHKSVSAESAFGRAHAGELVSQVTELEDLCSEELGPVEVHARRYGADGRVLALVRRPTTNRR
jgi:hypothetical protein